MCVQDHRAELPLESLQPCRETAGAQAPKHTLCNARAAGRAAGIRQTNPDFGDCSFITAITNTQAVTKLRRGTQTHRKWRQHKTWGARAGRGGCWGHSHCLHTPEEEQRPCEFERLWAGRGGLELHQPITCTPARALQGTQNSRVPKAGREMWAYTPNPPFVHPTSCRAAPRHRLSLFTLPRGQRDPQPHQLSPAPEPQPGRTARGPTGCPRPPFPRPENHLKRSAGAPTALRLP